ncbi:MAG: hypothetical protein ABW168_20570 [Sedimenticola sp.]
MRRLFMSQFALVYFLGVTGQLYIGYTDAIEIGGNLFNAIIGLSLGLFVGALNLVVFRYTIFIPDYVERNQARSIGALIGLGYFIICLAFVFYSLFITSRLVELLL